MLARAAGTASAATSAAPSNRAMLRRLRASDGSRVIHPSLTAAPANPKRQPNGGARRVAVDRRVHPRKSEAVVHLEFERVRRHAKARDLLVLELDVCIDHVVGEYAAARHELAILVEAVERLVERRAGMRHLRGFLGLEVVEVLVHRVARMDPVLHAIEA